jgi:hypothetical protein
MSQGSKIFWSSQRSVLYDLLEADFQPLKGL